MTAPVGERRAPPGGRRGTRLVIVADDLTGAADSAASFAPRTDVVLPLDPQSPWPDAALIAVDTDTRHAAPDTAAERVFSVVRRAAADGSVVYKKIDSLARGNIGVEVRAAVEALRDDGVPPIVVLAPAFPTAGRATLGGVIHAWGEPLETEGHVVRVSDLLASQRFQVVEMSRPADPADVVRHLAVAVRTGHDAIVIDASTDEDLSAIVRGTRLFGGPVLLVGSGGLARHLVELFGSRPDPARALVPALVGPALFVVGSHSPIAAAQLRALVAAGVRGVPLRVGRQGDTARVLREQLAGGADVAIYPHPSAPVAPDQGAAVAYALATSAAEVLDVVGTLVATGGETARAVLTAAGIGLLHIVGELEPGVVVSYPERRAPIVITKPGAFGDTSVLVRCLPTRRTEES